jgi:hypothetical protein
VDDVYVRRGDQPRRGSGLISVTGGSAMLARVVAFGFASRCLADEVLPELIQVGDVVASSHS